MALEPDSSDPQTSGEMHGTQMADVLLVCSPVVYAPEPLVFLRMSN